MRFGLFSNGQGIRDFDSVARSWDEDLHEIVLSDRLGLSEAWVSEHTGAPHFPHALPVPELLIAKAAALTSQIKLGTAVRRIALYQPVQVAMEAAATDQLTNGRYIFGFGSGAPSSGFDQRDIEFSKAHEMMVEGMDLISRCWTERDPFTFEGRHYRGKNISIWPKPYQSKLPVAIATTRDSLLSEAASKGWRVLTSQFAAPRTINRIASSYSRAAAALGDADPRRNVTAVRAVYIADSDERAFADLAPSWRKHLDYTRKYFSFALADFKPASGDLNDLTFESLAEAGLVFVGSPRTVAGQIEQFHRESGGFGNLLVVGGKDWASHDQRERSFELLATTVAPMLKELGSTSPGSEPSEWLAKDPPVLDGDTLAHIIREG